jgi:hypothetical protein
MMSGLSSDHAKPSSERWYLSLRSLMTRFPQQVAIGPGAGERAGHRADVLALHHQRLPAELVADGLRLLFTDAQSDQRPPQDGAQAQERHLAGHRLARQPLVG